MSNMDSSWIPVTYPETIPSDHSSYPQTIPSDLTMNKTYIDLNINISNQTFPFLDTTSEDISEEEPVEVIVSRVIYALLISVSLVLNLLLIIAVLRRRADVRVIYLLVAAMIVPDLIFYTKLIVELMNWGSPIPLWASSDTLCGLWQFATHAYPIVYSCLLVAIVYHSFIALFLDYTGQYEKVTRRWLPLILVGVFFLLGVVVAPSGFYGRAKADPSLVSAHYQQYCDLKVPSITGDDSPAVSEAAAVSYRLVYEMILPYILPLVLLGFPYVTLMLGLMRNLAAASHTDYGTKMTVVLMLWLVTSYMMLHVAAVLRNVFSVFNVWHRLQVLFDALDDTRVPRFQTYIHITAYSLTCTWAIIRPILCFKYNYKLRKALGP